MKRKYKILILLAALSLVFAGWKLYSSKMIQSEHEDEIEYVIGVSQANMREGWRLALIQEIEEEARKHKNVRIVTMDATSSLKKQKQDVDKLQKYGIDLLIISPCDSSHMTEKVKEVYERGIPVIVMDRAVEVLTILCLSVRTIS
ncbi:substrate-binding domain-containing protein [Blautia sp. An249]|uniref:substrate-binding domain-containing protein n=1 Tax=Blautia sp. An249 TaxID=1965603 RepID=UPI0023BA3B92|nr:substrate-binding domain-containing protein [Blautia sp. An249]